MSDRQEAAQRKRAIVDDARRAASISDISAAWDVMKPLWGRWQDAGFAGEEEQALRAAYDVARDVLKRRTDEERQERERQQYQAKENKLWVIDQLRTWIGSPDRARAWSEVKAIQGKFRGAGYAGKEHNADLNVAFSRAFEDFRLWSNSEIHKEIMAKIASYEEWRASATRKMDEVSRRIVEMQSWDPPHPRDPQGSHKMQRRLETIRQKQDYLESLRQKRYFYEERLMELRTKAAKYR